MKFQLEKIWVEERFAFVTSLFVTGLGNTCKYLWEVA